MQPLYRYFSKQNAESFIERGEVLFRSLSYFRDYEDEYIRSDKFEGILVHCPLDGLKVNKVETGETIITPYQSEFMVKADDIFIYCMSTERSLDIAQKFRAEQVVEIFDPLRFLALVRSSLSLRRRLRAHQLVHQPVRYYGPDEPPIIDWALPDRIAMRKPNLFNWQKEYRFAVPLGDAFRIGNVSSNLVLPSALRLRNAESHPVILLKLGNLSRLCRVSKI